MSDSTQSSNVIQFPGNTVDFGDLGFALCACDSNEVLAPVVLRQNPPVIVGLVCPSCGGQRDVVNGVIDLDSEDAGE